jgi:hypothetical protein
MFSPYARSHTCARKRCGRSPRAVLSACAQCTFVQGSKRKNFPSLMDEPSVYISLIVPSYKCGTPGHICSTDSTANDALCPGKRTGCHRCWTRRSPTCSADSEGTRNLSTRLLLSTTAHLSKALSYGPKRQPAHWSSHASIPPM